MRSAGRLLVPLAAVHAFLYLPILSMVIYSFNASRLVTVWDSVHSPTLAWYVELFGNEEILEAARLSLRVAAVSATGQHAICEMANPSKEAA